MSRQRKNHILKRTEKTPITKHFRRQRGPQSKQNHSCHECSAMNVLGRHLLINRRVSAVHATSRQWLYRLCSNTTQGCPQCLWRRKHWHLFKKKTEYHVAQPSLKLGSCRWHRTPDLLKCWDYWHTLPTRLQTGFKEEVYHLLCGFYEEPLDYLCLIRQDLNCVSYSSLGISNNLSTLPLGKLPDKGD